MYNDLLAFIFLLIIFNFIIFTRISEISKYLNIYDKPDNELKKHSFNTPLLGGVIMFLNLSAIYLYYILFDYDLLKLIISIKEQIAIIFLSFSFFLLGLIDDKYGIKPEKKIILSILFSIFVIIFDENLLITNFKLSFFNKVLFLNEFSYLFTIFCFIILINALNFYDGINGQSSIFFIVCFIYLALKSQLSFLYFLIIIILMFILILNLYNKLFMGDSGIYLTGSILIISLIYEYKILKNIGYADEIFFLLIIPGYDLLRLSIVRILSRKNAFYGDRNHIHHLLIDKYSLLQTNLILFFLATLPIILFSFLKLNFFLVLFLITNIYIFIVLKFKK